MGTRELITMIAAAAALLAALGANALAAGPGERGGAQVRGQLETQVESAASAAAAITGRQAITAAATPGATPEKEIERRRTLINAAFNDFQGIAADARMPIGDEGAQRASGSLGDRRAGPILDPGTAPGEASARDEGRGSDAERSARASDRSLAAPPRAIPIEGRVVIQGGEGSATAASKGGREVSYTVEERFVGNLIVAEKGDARRDYEIDTISTAIQVTSLQGSICRERGEGACARSTPFVASSVGERNRYGQFNDGVVEAATQGNRVKIEVESPEVTFASGDGSATARLNCSGASFELGAEEFRRLADAGAITLTHQVSGTRGGAEECRPGSTITLHLSVKGR